MIESALSDPSIILEMHGVSKKFSYSLASTRKYGLRDLLRSGLGITEKNTKLRKNEFWALNNISIKLKRGETVGIIGLNGSGKSTILKLINGLFMPDMGEIQIKGKVGALIELGAGFHPMLTGRENIYLKGALLGKTKDEMDDICQNIIDFAELGEFIDSPIKSYSSGMHVRLGFSVSVHITPDILLMDEVLAVGDFQFKQKCMDKINKIREFTSTIFVSHSMGTVSLICDRVIVLNKGVVVFEGDTDDAIKYYTAIIDDKDKIKKPNLKIIKDIKPFYGELFFNEKKIDNISHYWADKKLKTIEQATTGDEVNIIVKFTLKTKPVKQLIVGIPIWDKNGNYITGIASDMDGIKLRRDKHNRYTVILNFSELIFNPSDYISIIAIHDGLEFYYRGLNSILSVTNHKRYFGFVTATHNWIVK